MLNLSTNQIENKISFITNYCDNQNAASSSTVDPNANVSSKNIATLESEINKDINIQTNRALMQKKIKELFGEELAQEYLRQIQDHEIYVHDETSLKPYCASISLYPFLLSGLTSMGGESGPPKHLDSFVGSFINLVFAVSSQFAGAIATVEFLMYFDYFARKDLGEDYLNTHCYEINNHLQSVIYSINQPAAARGYQSVFWNISVFDQHYFEAMFGEFRFPDHSPTNWDSVKKLQTHFLDWFNKERTRAVLTFPVVTAAMLVNDKEPKDLEFADMCANELANGNSFFIYQSKNADSLSSCCRLRNEITDNSFSYTLGAGGVATGSINVITLNMNRLFQNKTDLPGQLDKLYKYQAAYRSLMNDFKSSGLLPAYDSGFITLDKQFLTIGINGLVEAAEFMGYTASNNPEYMEFIDRTLSVIYQENQKARKKYGLLFNTELVPAENLGIKNAKWDKTDGYKVSRDCYNSYFYPVEDESINTLDKFSLYSKRVVRNLDGGAALHLNLDESLSKEQYLKLLNISAKNGCQYFCINVKITICNECDHISKQTTQKCKRCNSQNIDYATRIIGYLKKITDFSAPRQEEHKLRFYHRKEN